MKQTALLLSFCLFSMFGFCQVSKPDSILQAIKYKKDSTLRAWIHADSVKVQKSFAMKTKMAQIKPSLIYPVINAGDGSGVIPVKERTEIPDPTMDYKLLFEFILKNPDSAAAELNYSLVEIARIINLHVASGIPLKKIFPVIVVHGGALNVITTNAYYKEHFKMDNPNLKLINELEASGARFIACGQAMTYFDVKKEALLPFVKVSLTAQTVLSSYGLKGYVKY
jgi:intracellular sulfur oxidation DsrE/DsrF family protein